MILCMIFDDLKLGLFEQLLIFNSSTKIRDIAGKSGYKSGYKYSFLGLIYITCKFSQNRYK